MGRKLLKKKVQRDEWGKRRGLRIMRPTGIGIGEVRLAGRKFGG
jgi:hypothetical protein